MKQYLFNNLIQKIQQIQWLPLFVLYNIKYTNLHEWDKRLKNFFQRNMSWFHFKLKCAYIYTIYKFLAITGNTLVLLYIIDFSVRQTDLA